ncbi:MAG: hypothetical protein A3C30_02695 [Candidatus Levybacteria bacterium RIFCSPHIGHO2_02_FULL_40_18]|nr:MAG: hypothetical protein A2869_05280 [Candidatus Levybacteria bacterium RIFCSPHIGHO2_01_FULL_40_58]OGH26884.1 MAG: hypothetical protein A3C30_02695 [Candidatus Levybacteria bacterium RIFCSPHIGHO2_02_FULL_40_18]OGH32006.1 MAG: hypothetical protein A3E43_03675 [Candidatus Levybacteria bacterium RIFCSPHIGHO2_12_FULL_40_31]OGH40872.1 MAG: hypothetical protein A2894_04725 [Candidatus Levybacteria bacterium RIFCSPLOWO2_01_FULL_40_64]OGH49556.1 MAG: hypothetical protein A3I54_00220 [Candidatus Lev
MKKVLWLLAFGFWLLALMFPIVYSIPLSVSAQKNKGQFSLGIYPPIFEINAQAPANIDAKINIQNLSEFSQNLSITFKSFRPDEKGDGTLRYEAAPPTLQKIKVYDGENPLEQITLDPFESRDLALKMDIESNTPGGDYYFSVIFLSQENQDSKISQSKITGGIGTNVILSVGRKGPFRGQIKEFSIPRLVTHGPVPITLLLANNSSYYLNPTGRIIIQDMFHREAGQINILPQYVLANSSRFMKDSDQASPTFERAAQIERLESDHPVLIWPETFLFGLYTAYAHIKLSENGPVFETKASFIAIPAYMLFAISFLAFVLIGIYLRVKKKI